MHVAAFKVITKSNDKIFWNTLYLLARTGNKTVSHLQKVPKSSQLVNCSVIFQKRVLR